MNVFEQNFLATAVGDEGGFAPNFQDNKEGTDKYRYREILFLGFSLGF